MPLPLAQNAVEAWVVDLTRHDQVECAHAILSQDERARAARFHFAVDRNRFILARGALRQILASHEGVHPAEIAFCYSEFGKPRLRTTHGDLRFNLSHSSDRALVACTRGREVGVDIECIRQDLDIDDLAKRFFCAQENGKLRALPAEIRYLGFLHCWTCKEAYVKKVGKGLSLGLDKFDVSAALTTSEVVLSSENQEFALEDCLLIALGTEVVRGYRAALVVEKPEPPISILIRRFPDNFDT